MSDQTPPGETAPVPPTGGVVYSSTPRVLASVSWGRPGPGAVAEYEYRLTDVGEVAGVLDCAASQAGAGGAPFLVEVCVDPRGPRLQVVVGGDRAMVRYLAPDGDGCFVGTGLTLPMPGPVPCDQGGRLVLLPGEHVRLTREVAVGAAGEFVASGGCLPTCVPGWTVTRLHHDGCLAPDLDAYPAACAVFVAALTRLHRPRRPVTAVPSPDPDPCGEGR